MKIYTVKSGDSIYSIAREYGTTPTAIIQDNLLDNPSRLVVGEDKRRTPHVGNNVGHGEGLTAAGDAQQGLRGVTAKHALCELANGLRLVARGLI